MATTTAAITYNHCGARVINVDPKRITKASLSFSGCGFLCIYHAGVCAALKEYAPQLLRNPICGSSAGSIIAAAIACDVCISQATSLFLSVVSEVRSYTFGALNRDFDLMKLVRTKLNAFLPDNAHELCSDRLRISVTRFSDMENVILSEFCTKDELIDAICCSCFIPVYGGFVYPTFRGEIYIDGGASDNQPVIDANTITVSPFSGETDICPSDLESASLFDWNFAGTSIRLTTNNLYRAAVCLFPPSTEECASMCRNGFKDALKFLISNGFASSAVCLSVEADLSADLNQINEAAAVSATPSNYKMYQGRLRPSQKSTGKVLRTSRSATGVLSEWEDTERIDPAVAIESSKFPESVQSAFDEAMKKDGFLDYISSFRIVRLARYMTMPLTITVQLFKFCQCLSSWLATRVSKRIVDDWCSIRVKQIVDFILSEIHAQEVKVSARLSQQLAVTEIELSGTGQRPFVREQLLDITLSQEAIKEREALLNIDRLLSKKASKSAEVASSSAIPLEEGRSDADNPSCPVDTSSVSTSNRHILEGDDNLSQIIEHTTECDALLAFYYTAKGNKLRVCEIFDVDHPEKRHHCHSTQDE